jgi:hypothetical protein
MRGFAQARILPFGGNVFAQFIGRVGVSMKHEFTGLLEYEYVSSDYGSQRAISRCVTFLTCRLDSERSCQQRVFVRSDEDVGNRARRPKVDQAAVWLEPGTRAAQGIDHALGGKSSQRP